MDHSEKSDDTVTSSFKNTCNRYLLAKIAFYVQKGQIKMRHSSERKNIDPFFLYFFEVCFIYMFTSKEVRETTILRRETH